MILPGTLVQYVKNNSRSNLRRNGVYTVRSTREEPAAYCRYGCGGTLGVYVCEAAPMVGVIDGVLYRGCGYCVCVFRIIAPPITEADRLEASAPAGGVKLKPAVVKGVPASQSQMADDANGRRP